MRLRAGHAHDTSFTDTRRRRKRSFFDFRQFCEICTCEIEIFWRGKAVLFWTTRPSMFMNICGNPRAPRDMAQRVRTITKPEHLKALASPIRHDIIDRLAALGPLSVRDLAHVLGRKPTAIYRHLISLEKLGLVLASANSGAKGRPAMLYRTAAPLAGLKRAPRISGGPAPMVKIASAMARQAARDYAAAFKFDGWIGEGAKRNHGFFELVTSPSPKKLAKINALLEDLAQLMWLPDDNSGRPIRMTWFMSPSTKMRAKKAKRAGGEDRKIGPQAEVVKFSRRHADDPVSAGRVARPGGSRQRSAA